jgi:hypothetical protein
MVDEKPEGNTIWTVDKVKIPEANFKDNRDTSTVLDSVAISGLVEGLVVIPEMAVLGCVSNWLIDGEDSVKLLDLLENDSAAENNVPTVTKLAELSDTDVSKLWLADEVALVLDSLEFCNRTEGLASCCELCQDACCADSFSTDEEWRTLPEAKIEASDKVGDTMVADSEVAKDSTLPPVADGEPKIVESDPEVWYSLAETDRVIAARNEDKLIVAELLATETEVIDTTDELEPLSVVDWTSNADIEETETNAVKDTGVSEAELKSKDSETWTDLEDSYLAEADIMTLGNKDQCVVACDDCNSVGDALDNWAILRVKLEARDPEANEDGTTLLDTNAADNEACGDSVELKDLRTKLDVCIRGYWRALAMLDTETIDSE